MTDYWHKFTQWLDYNRGLALALVVAAALGVWLIGCQSRTPSLGDPGTLVTRQEFQVESLTERARLDKRRAALEAEASALNTDVAAFNARAELGVQDLDRQDEARVQLTQLTGELVTSALAGTLTPASGVATAVSIAGILATLGLLWDNRRKDGVIAAKKAGVAAPSAPST